MTDLDEYSRKARTWLAGHPFLIDFWTRFIVCVELAFPLLVWHRPLRPFVLAG